MEEPSLLSVKPPSFRAWFTGSLNYRHVNEAFTFACYLCPPVFGSAVSFVFNGGAIWCAFEIVTGRRRPVLASHVLVLTATLWAYVLARIVSAAVNGELVSPQLIGLATLFAFPFSYSIWSISDKAEIARSCLLASALACFGALALAMFQYFSIGRAEGGAGNPLVFAAVTTLAGSICFAGGMTATGRHRALLIGASVAGAFAVLLSLSRGLWPAYLLNPVVIAWICRTGYRPSWRALAFFLIALAAASALSYGIILERFSHLSAAWTEMRVAGNYDTSFGLRVALLQIGWDLWLERPLFGYGAESLQQMISSRLLSDFGIESGLGHFHNAFVHSLVEAGIPGLVTSIAVLVVPLGLAIRTLGTRSDEAPRFGAMLLIVAVVTFFTSGMSTIMLGHDILDATYMIALVVGSYLALGASSLPGGGRVPQASPEPEQTGTPKQDTDGST